MLTDGTYLADRYEILNRIGAGGMSDVYKAKDHILGRFVAVKVLKAEFSEDRSFVSKFRTEAQSAAGLEHPNIVNIYDVGSEDGRHYIVMEHVEGITLKTYIEKKGQLTFKESASIAIQVARGIEAAHNKQIIHRDIKPQNIMISTEGKVKVMDFGIAKAASSNTISSDVMGSVHYSSPEQARNGFVDGRSDIYSLGIVMYEMVTGRVPFDGDTTVSVAIQHLQEEIPNPADYTPNLPVSMEKIILKCTQKNPDRRYQNIRDLLNDLRRALVSPEDDFVLIAPAVDNSRTKVISEVELRQIRDRGGETAAAPKENDADETEEDEGEEAAAKTGLSPKLDKAVTIMGIVIAIIILFVIIRLISTVFDLFHVADEKKPDKYPGSQHTESQSGSENSSDPENLVEMISLKDKPQDQAMAELDAIGLHMFVIAAQKSEKPAGTILDQNVAAGRMIPVGTTINVVVAGPENIDYVNGPPVEDQNVQVLPVVGMIEADAVRTLEEQNLQPIKNYQYSEEVEAGRVISQNPEAGTSVAQQTRVTIVISQGQKSVVVPRVIGETKDAARDKLESAGLRAKFEEAHDDEVEAGLVVRQSLPEGRTVPSGTEVTIIVSLGPEEEVYYSYYNVFTAPDNAVSASYTLVGSDGFVYAEEEDVDVLDTLEVSAEDMECSEGTVTIEWTIVTVDEEGLSDTVTMPPMTFPVEFTKQ